MDSSITTDDKAHRPRVLLIGYTVSNLLMSMATVRHLYPEATVDMLSLDTSPESTVAKRQIAAAFPAVDSLMTAEWRAIEGWAQMPAIFLRRIWRRALAPALAYWATRRMRRRFGGRDYAAIFYTHAIVGNLMDLAAATWPTAKLICCGDPFGVFMEKKYYLGLIGVSVPPHPFLPEHRPALAAGALPIDQSGWFHTHTPLCVVSREELLDTIRQAAAGVPGLTAYQNGFLAEYAGRPLALLMGETFAEGDFLPFETELALYADAAKRHVPPGTTVIYKPHPGEKLPRAEQLALCLGDDYAVVSLDSRYKFFPVELLEDIIAACCVCVGIGYPVLSLSYLYNKNVIDPAQMDQEFINRWIGEDIRDLYHLSQIIHRETLKSLPGWDGKSYIWYPGMYPDHFLSGYIPTVKLPQADA